MPSPGRVGFGAVEFEVLLNVQKRGFRLYVHVVIFGRRQNVKKTKSCRNEISFIVADRTGGTFAACDRRETKT